MAELATAYISVVAETSGIPRSIRAALGQSQRDADTQGRSIGRTFSSSFGSSLKTLGAAAGVTGGIAGVAGAMKSAVSSGMDFTTSLNTMQAVAGASSAQIAQVSAKARALGTDNQLAATSSVDAAQAMVELAKGGFTVDQSMQAARGTLQLAAAAQISAADAATIQSQALQAFGKDASFAGTASDILANAANQSSAEITDVAQAFQQSGAVANQFGLSMNDTAATIALLANAGIQGSDAGTLLKSTLLALTDTGKPAQAAIDELGLTVYDAQGKFVGMERLFGQLQAASKRMTPEMYQAATATLFGSDAARIAGVAAQQGAGGFDKMRDAMGQQGAAAQVAAAKMNGLPGAWEKFKNAAQDAGLAFYDAVQGPLTSAATWAAGAIGSITDTTSGLGAKVKDAFSSVSEAFQNAGGMELVSDWGSRIKGVFDSLWGSIQNLLPVVGNLGEMFAQAGAIVSAIGIETLVSALEAVAGVLDTTIVPFLQLANSALSGMQPVVVAAVAAWLGFKAVAPALAAMRAQVGALASTSTGAAGVVRNFAQQNTLLSNSSGAAQARLMALAGIAQASNGRFQELNGRFISTADAQRRMAEAARTALPVMGRFGTAIQQIGMSSPVVSRMQTSFVNAATGADRFGRTAGIAAAAGTGLKAAGSGLAGVFGGPLGLAFTGAIIAGGAWMSSVQRQNSAVDAYKGSLQSLAEEQKRTKELLIDSKGALTPDVFSSVTSQVNAVRDSFTNAGKATADFNDALVSGLTFGINDQEKKVNDAAAANRAAESAINSLGMTSEAVGRQLSGSAGGWEQLKSRLLAIPEGGDKAAASLQGVRDKILQQQEIGRRVTPGITELGTAFQVMGDKSASASDKLGALKAAMDAMNPARSKTEADAQYGEAVRKATEAVQGIDGSAFDPSGKLNAMSEAGANLSRTLSDLAEKSAQVASNNGDMGAVARQNEQQFQALATATNQPIEKIRELYGSLGGKAVDLSVKLQGAPDVINQLAAISAQWNNTPDKKTIEVEESSVNAQTRTALEHLNATVSQPMNGIVTITANDEVAKSRILMITQNIGVLNALKANPQVDLNTLQFDGKNAAARADLTALSGMDIAPQARLIIDQLLQGKTVSISALDQLARTPVAPEAKLLISKLLADAGVAGTALDQIARDRIARINVEVQGLNYGDRTPSGGVFRGPGVAKNADGSIRKYADGGLTKLPESALIQKPKGAGLVQWAEPETKGEAFIPLAESKRNRSQNILATVADMFGFALLPKDNIPDTLSGQIGGVAGGALSSLMKTMGGGVAKFADGGIRTAQEIRAFVNGAGASRPLTGAPYVWGGVNWGDCCLDFDTPVWGPNGVTPIGEIKPGQQVWSYVDGKLEAHEVTAAWFSKRQETFKVRTYHRSVIGSVNHPFLRLVQTSPAHPRVGRRGWEPAEYDVEWARLDQLRPGDMLVQPKTPRVDFAANSLPSGRPIGLNEAWLLGLILGDGNVSDSKVEICVYGDLRDRARRVLNGLALSANSTRRERAGIHTSDSDAHGLRAYSTQFATELTEAGFRKPAHEKRIPDCVWGWDADRQRAFLNGYCDADGHHPTDVAHHGERTYASASRALIEDVRYLHIVVGDVVANVSTNHRRKPIVINGKSVKAARPLHSITVRPQGETLVSSVAARRQAGVAHWIDTSDFTVAPIIGITEQGEKDTYDITVEGAHNFIAGGLVVHNSGAMAAIARFAAGLDPFAGRFSTANEGDALAQLGAKMGAGGPGTLRFGWYNGGPGGGHTAGTLPDGTNVEMGGSYGGGMVGGNVGANDAKFTNQAYMEVKGGSSDSAASSSTTGASASGSSVPDSQLGSGYTFDPITSDTSAAGSGDTSLSGRAGSVASAFITGQLQDLFKVLSVNDQPGWLSAITEYEKQHSADAKKNYDALKKKLDADYKDGEAQRKADYDEAKAAIDNDFQANLISAAERDRRQMALRAQFDADEIAKRHDYENDVVATAKGYGQADDSSVQSLSMKQRYENEQLAQTQRLSTAQFDRDAQYDRDKKALESLRDSKSISQDEYQRRLAQTKAKYDSDMRGIKDRFATDQGALKERFDRSQDQLAPMDRYIPNTVTTSRFAPSDPGTTSVGAKGDSQAGGATKKDIKEAFKDGLRQEWRFGEPWTDTDWLINKESTWQPDARNGKFYGLGQWSPEAWAAAGQTETTDPTVQGRVHDSYVGGRYQTPQNARDHWKKNNWYDQGGAAIGTGLMAKNVLAPERVLSPRQTAAFEDMVQANFRSDTPTEVPDSGDNFSLTINNPTFSDRDSMMRAATNYQRRQMMRHAGRP